MRRNWSHPSLTVLAAVLIVITAPSAPAASKYRVLHSFGKGEDGGGLLAGVALDAKGDLYGGTTGGGVYGYGTVFELTPGSGGKWTETILHSFCPKCGDGAGMADAPTLDPVGDLFGSTNATSFEITPGPGGWSFTVIYDRSSGGFVLDEHENLYAAGGPGKYNYGDVFELSPGSGGWTEKDLYDFHGGCDGDEPAYPLTWDNAGNLYGVTIGGGCHKIDMVYQLRPTNGQWKEHVLRRFPGFNGDGYAFHGGVTFRSDTGNLYGTTMTGGKHANGTVYELSPQSDGKWKETIIHQFPVVYDGASPVGMLAIDPAGNLHGVAGGGTGPCGGGGCGLVYRLTPGKNGKWEYKVLHRFTGPDGAAPQAGPTLDSKGNLFGTTQLGGKYGYGVVFELTP